MELLFGLALADDDDDGLTLFAVGDVAVDGAEAVVGLVRSVFVGDDDFGTCCSSCSFCCVSFPLQTFLCRFQSNF